MASELKAIIFHHETLLTNLQQPVLIAQIRLLLERLKSKGLTIVAFSTHQYDISRELSARGLPNVDLFITRDDVGVNKGSPEWIDVAARKLGVANYQLLFVGKDKYSWTTAISAATLHLHARWAARLPPKVTTLVVDDPEGVWRFITHFLLPLRWEYILDGKKTNVRIRCLLNANAVLPATNPSQFKLQDVLTYQREIVVGNKHARDFLVLHAITSLYSEGLIKPNSWFSVYPSSEPNKRNPILEEFLELIAKLFHGYYKENLLVRAVAAPNTSRLRASGQRDKVNFANQTDTVHVNAEYEATIKGKAVIVFDDFTSSGMSLDWARNLLQAAGVGDISLITVGKYGGGNGKHEARTPISETIIEPFRIKQYDWRNDFQVTSLGMTRNHSVQEILRNSFDCLARGEPMS